MAPGIKTTARIARIERGALKDSTLAARADKVSAIAEIRAISGQPHTDHGANTGEEIQMRDEIASSMAADQYQAPNDSSAVEIKTSETDPRYVPISFLLDDLRRRAKFQLKGFSKSARADIATDAALILMRWTKQGAKAPIYIGPSGELPLRRQWLDPDKRTVIRDGKSTRPAPSERAERAMRAALKQAANDRNTDTDNALENREPDSISLDDVETSEYTVAQQSMRRDQERAEFAPSLPDADAPELLAQALGVTLTAARAAYAQAFLMSNPACAEQWQVSVKRAENIRSAGSTELRKRWPDPAELVDAIRAAVPAMRELLATRAWLAISAYRDAPSWVDHKRLLARAEQSVNEWRAANGEVPMERRAIELAARRVGWLPENIGVADYLKRLLGAETKRARARSGAVATAHSHLSTVRDRLDDRSVQGAACIAPTEPLRAAMCGRYARMRLYRSVRIDEFRAYNAT